MKVGLESGYIRVINFAIIQGGIVRLPYFPNALTFNK
jgi:hypothetical protein